MALSSGSFDEAHRHFTAATKLDPHNSVVSCKLSVISRRNARAREIQRHATRRERPSNFVRVFFPFFYISHRESSCRPILNAKFTRKVSFLALQILLSIMSNDHFWLSDNMWVVWAFQWSSVVSNFSRKTHENLWLSKERKVRYLKTFIWE